MAGLSGRWAERLGAMQPFLVMEVLERAQALQRAGRSVIHLEVGEPDFPTPTMAAEAGSAAIAAGDTHYTHSLGLLELREAISHRYESHYGVAVDPDRILVTCGSSLALLYLFGALLNPGDEVLAATPHYPCYPNFIRFFGGTFVPVPTDPMDGYRLDPAEVRRRVTPRTRALLLNSPSNPTGAVLTRDRMAALADIGVPILSDEIYHDLVYGEPAASALEFSPDAWVLDGFSKRFAMTGWRLGYLVAPAGCMRPLQILQQNFLISAAPFAQRAGVAALALGDSAVAPLREAYDARRRLTVKLLHELGFGVPAMPEGAFYVFADASRYTGDSLAFAFELLEATGVAIAPGIDFGDAGRCAIRVSYAASEENLREAASRIGEYLRNRG